MRVPTITNEQALDAWNALNDHGVYEAVGELVLDYVEGDLDQDFSDLDLMDLVDTFENIKFQYRGKNKIRLNQI